MTTPKTSYNFSDKMAYETVQTQIKEQSDQGLHSLTLLQFVFKQTHKNKNLAKKKSGNISIPSEQKTKSLIWSCSLIFFFFFFFFFLSLYILSKQGSHIITISI